MPDAHVKTHIHGYRIAQCVQRHGHNPDMRSGNVFKGKSPYRLCSREEVHHPSCHELPNTANAREHNSNMDIVQFQPTVVQPTTHTQTGTNPDIRNGSIFKGKSPYRCCCREGLPPSCRCLPNTANAREHNSNMDIAMMVLF